MSEILKSPVLLDKIYAVPYYQTREQYETETGKPCPPYDPGRRIQNFEVLDVDFDEDLAEFMGLAIDKNDPMGRPLLGPDGKPYTKAFRMLPQFACSVNIPPKVSGVPRLSTPAYPVPLKWDADNYELFLRTNLDQLPWVRDKRAPVELTDSQKLDAIYRVVMKGE